MSDTFTTGTLEQALKEAETYDTPVYGAIRRSDKGEIVYVEWQEETDDFTLFFDGKAIPGINEATLYAFTSYHDWMPVTNFQYIP